MLLIPYGSHVSRNRKTNIYLGTTQCIPFRPLLPYFIWYAFHELGGKIVHSIVDEWPKATVTWPLRKLIFLEHKAMAMLTLSFVAFFKKSLFLHLTKILFSVLYCLFYRKSLFQTCKLHNCTIACSLCNANFISKMLNYWNDAGGSVFKTWIYLFYFMNTTQKCTYKFPVDNTVFKWPFKATFHGK